MLNIADTTMLVNYYFPFSLSAYRLDKYLASGWFRNCNMLFKAKVLCLDGQLNNVINIRLDIKKQDDFTKKQKKIYALAKNSFTIKIQNAIITPEKEKLYLNHQARFKGYIYKTLSQFLFGESPSRLNIYNTKEICVYDGEQLVAFSFFDLGKQSIASILCVFDSQYSKYSLGHFTMMEEITYAKEHAFKYYYPGYILDQSNTFDYKLKMGKFDYYDGGKWRSYESIKYENLDGNLIIGRLKEYESKLIKENIEHKWKYYPYFSLGYFQDIIHPFVKSPIHLVLEEDKDEGRYKIVEYDIETDYFNITEVIECPEYDFILKQQDKLINQNDSNQWEKVLRYN